MPRVSVIVPNYNHGIYLADRLDTILNQTYQDFEVILLDDCSKDNSREIIDRYREHPKVTKIIFNEVNSGTSYNQWYKGIEYARGELIWIAESDDICERHFLEVMVPCFENDDMVIAFSGSQHFRDQDNIKPPDLNANAEAIEGIEFIRRELLAKNIIYNASMAVFKKSRYDQIKNFGFRDMKLCGDWLLWIQMLDGYRLSRVHEIYNYFRQHEMNTTNRFRKEGLDILEGIKVLKTGKNYCRNRFNRKEVYIAWRKRYLVIKNEFSTGVNRTVLISILRNEPFLYLFLLYKRTRKYIKLILFQGK